MGAYGRRECHAGALSRVIGLPSPMAPITVTAPYEHGVLRPHLHKTEVAKAKQLPVKELTTAR